MSAQESTPRTKTLWVREPYLAQILAGAKTVEVRVGYDNIRRLRPGDRLKLNDEHLATIRRIDRYADFEELVAREDAAAIAPGQSPGKLLVALRQIYPPDKEALGAVALELMTQLPAEGTGERRYDAVLFDMGYTLVHFEPPQEEIVQEALRALGAERTVEEISAAVQVVWGAYYRAAATVGFPATPEYDRESQEALGRGLLRQLGVEGDDETLQAYTDSIEDWFSRPGVMRPYPEVVDVLGSLKQRGYRLGIVSNWSWNLRDRVAQVELDSYFEIVWASAYAGCNKPHLDIFHQALGQMNLPPDRALYVGDSYQHDVIGARNAGMDVVLVDRVGGDDRDCPVIGDLWGVFELLEDGATPPSTPRS
jgi:HAD superfamily hydrolase (TIGR01662 family)